MADAQPDDAILAAALDRMIEEAMTVPLTVTELSQLFNYDRTRIGDHLLRIGAEKFGNRWRVPLRKMPPDYLVALRKRLFGCASCGSMLPDAASATIPLPEDRRSA